MKYVASKVLIVLIITCLLVLYPARGYAQSVRLHIDTDPAAVNVGDVFTVTVTFTNDGEAMDALQASLKYDAARMKYLSGGGNAVELSNGSGGISDNGAGAVNTMRYSLRFLALKAGKTKFSVTKSEVIGFESGVNLGSPASSSTVIIKEIEDQPEGSQDNEEKDPLEISIEDKKFYILRDLSGVELPQGFESESFSYKGAEVEAAVQPVSGLVLLYLMDEASEGSFYLYDPASNAFNPYTGITVNALYTLLPPDVVPKGFSLSKATIDGKTTDVCIPDTGRKDLYLVRALNSSGAVGYYFYDSAEGSMQRVLVETVQIPAKAALSSPIEAPPTAIDAEQEAKLAVAPATQKDNGDILVSMVVMAGVCILLAVVVILLIVHINKKRRARNKF